MHLQFTTRRAPKGSAPPVTRLLDSTRKVVHLLCTHPHCRAWHPVSKPRDARLDDVFVMSYARDSRPFAGTPIEAGDTLIHLFTDDIPPRDLVTVRSRGGVYVGFLEIEDGRWLLTDGAGEPVEGYFDPSRVSLVGRCVEVQRAGLVIDAARRPAHAETRRAA